MFNYIFYGSGEISGSTTSAEIEEYSYRFINKEGKGEYATILASDCYIIPVEADVTPYLKVVTYREIKKP